MKEYQDGIYNYDQYARLTDDERAAAHSSVLVGLNADGTLAAIDDEFGENERDIPRDELVEHLKRHR